jgi:P-type Cu+ transporter
MQSLQNVEVPIQGMDCSECTRHVQKAIAALPGVSQVEVYLAAEKAVVQLDPHQVGVEQIRAAVEHAGYSVPQGPAGQDVNEAAPNAGLEDFTRPILTLLGLVFGIVLFIAVAGEWLGLFGAVTERIPWPVGWAIVIIGGYPVFRNVVRATMRGEVISHTLMTLGVIAALAVGEWATAAVVVLFMRVGDYVERFTSERARRAVKDLTALAPQTARLEGEEGEIQVPVGQVRPGQVVIVRPGEQLPVDGDVVAGHATLNQAAITGESMPVEAGPGAQVYAATLVQLGSLRVQASRVGADTTFGKVIRLVEEAEAHRANVQRIADRFSAWYLPVVAAIAALTLVLRRDPLATAAVLVVACSCSFALATPVAMLASIGAAAKNGLMIKGGRYLELLAKADTLLIDKTGTLTLGKPALVEICILPGEGLPNSSAGDAQSELVYLAASAERYSEHPLAEAVRAEANKRSLRLGEPQDFEALPGLGVHASVDGYRVSIGGRRMFDDLLNENAQARSAAAEMEERGQTLLFVALDGELVGLMGAADTLRTDAAGALRQARSLGIQQIELLTGDNERAAAALVEQLGSDLSLRYRANLLPEDKIAVVKDYQAQGHTVIMVGDGVNDAPALAQADVGIAIRGAGAGDIAIEAAHIVLMRDDWALVPEALRIARRTIGVVKMNIGFTAVYNVVGLSLAALGYLPPVMAAAAQSLPDLGILANSSRLLQHKPLAPDDDT